jgi:hypothetical protein
MAGLVPDGADMSLFIEQAHLVVDDALGDSEHSDQRLRLIELNLAAHYAVVALERGGLTVRRIGEAEERYANSMASANSATMVRLSSTRFGQQALMLDTTGILAKLNTAGGTAEFRVV